MSHEHRDDEINRLKEQLEKLSAQMHQMHHAQQQDAHQIQNLTHANALQNVLSQGLDAIREQLQPLRDLSPKRTPLDDEAAAKLAALMIDIARPLWNGEAKWEERDWMTAVPRRRYDSRAC